MKKYKNFIIYAFIFIIIMILAVVGYRYLSKNYVPEELQDAGKANFMQNNEIVNQEQNDEMTDSLQNIEEENTTQSETTTLKQATDFSVMNNNRRKGKLI